MSKRICLIGGIGLVIMGIIFSFLFPSIDQEKESDQDVIKDLTILLKEESPLYYELEFDLTTKQISPPSFLFDGVERKYQTGTMTAEIKDNMELLCHLGEDHKTVYCYHFRMSKEHIYLYDVSEDLTKENPMVLVQYKRIR